MALSTGINGTPSPEPHFCSQQPSLPQVRTPETTSCGSFHIYPILLLAPDKHSLGNPKNGYWDLCFLPSPQTHLKVQWPICSKWSSSSERGQYSSTSPPLPPYPYKHSRKPILLSSSHSPGKTDTTVVYLDEEHSSLGALYSILA